MLPRYCKPSNIDDVIYVYMFIYVSICTYIWKYIYIYMCGRIKLLYVTIATVHARIVLQGLRHVYVQLSLILYLGNIYLGNVLINLAKLIYCS